MKFSIVTPTFNSEKYLEETIESVVSQAGCEIEYIIADGGSTDNTLGIIEKYKQYISHVLVGPDTGMYDGLRQAFSIASGDIYAYINSDDYYLPGSLRSASYHFVANQNLKFLYGDYLCKYPNSSTIAKPKINWDYEIALNAYLMIAQPSSFWSSDLYLHSGGLSSIYKCCGDYDFFLRACKNLHTDEILHVKELFSVFRIHGTSKTVTQQQLFKSEMKSIRIEHGMITNICIRPFIKRYYLIRALVDYVNQRGYLPLTHEKPDRYSGMLNKD